MNKRCCRCGEFKPHDEFSKNSSTKDGLRSDCKSCQSESAKVWSQNNPERVKLSRKKWYEKNKEKVKEQSRRWAKENPEKIKESRRKWERRNPEKVKSKRRYPEKQKERDIKRKMFAIEYKGGKCEDCGVIGTVENRSIFDFHHVNPSTKESKREVQKVGSLDSIKEKLDKCVLLCSNCHRLRHQHYNDGLRDTL